MWPVRGRRCRACEFWQGLWFAGRGGGQACGTSVTGVSGISSAASHQLQRDNPVLTRSYPGPSPDPIHLAHAAPADESVDPIGAECGAHFVVFETVQNLGPTSLRLSR